MQAALALFLKKRQFAHRRNRNHPNRLDLLHHQAENFSGQTRLMEPMVLGRVAANSGAICQIVARRGRVNVEPVVGAAEEEEIRQRDRNES